MKEKFYITTAIAYTSKKPHIGNSYEVVLTDAIARFKRMQGYDVFFLTGTDEHGQKIEELAKESGVTPKEHVDMVAGQIKDICDTLNTTYDKFIRTTDADHEKVVQKIFNKLYEQGDIYLSEYEGWYCTPCESFWTETQLVDGKCPDCGREVKKTKESAYFLKLSKYQKQLEEYIEAQPDFIFPEGRKKEMINNFIKPGIQDLCVSRTSFKWGVPVDFDPKHVIYVWIDALSNYITAIGYDPDGSSDLYKKYWPADVHVIGKDILRFHTIYWPIMLMALGEPLPKKVFGHPWLLSGTDKMSKSRGNVIYADDLAKQFGVDAVRYYLLSEMPYTADGSITYESMIEKYNSDLANTIGNLVNRTVTMVNKYFDGTLPCSDYREDLDNDLIDTVTGTYSKLEGLMDEFRISDALETILNIAKRSNKYIDETAPWVLARDEAKKDRLSTVLYNLVESIRIMAILIKPFIPSTADEIMNQINCDITDYDTVKGFGYYKIGTKVGTATPLFNRIDAEKFLKELEASMPKPEPEKPAEPELPEVEIEHFGALDLRVAKILDCTKVEKSDKLLKLQVDIGSEKRQIVSGIAKDYSPDDLIGKKVIIIKNLKPAKIRGVESKGMLLASSGKDKINVIFAPENAEPGEKVR